MMVGFDYQAPAGLFTKTSRRMRGQSVKYRRFATAAEAIRCAIEELPAPILSGITMEVDEDTFDHVAIARLYDDPAYPLPREPVR
jgi:hypothetical protein